jgi:hypothetical protein
MQFQIDPQPGESQRACSAILKSTLPPSRGDLLLIGLFALVFAAAWYFARATLDATVLIGVAAIMATTYAMRYEGRRRVRGLQTADPHSLETHYIELSPEGLRAWCSHIEARYPWRDFSKVIDNNEFYLFIRPNGSGSAIPKRLLDVTLDAALRARIREWAGSHAHVVVAD